MQQLQMLLTLDVHLLDMFRIFRKVFTEIFDLILKTGGVVFGISWIL